MKKEKIKGFLFVLVADVLLALLVSTLYGGSITIFILVLSVVGVFSSTYFLVDEDEEVGWVVIYVVSSLVFGYPSLCLDLMMYILYFALGIQALFATKEKKAKRQKTEP